MHGPVAGIGGDGRSARGRRLTESRSLLEPGAHRARAGTGGPSRLAGSRSGGRTDGRITPSRRLRGQRPEPIELRLHEAAAGVGGRVDQPVAGHHAVLARAADPVVAGMIVGDEVEELDPPLARQDVSRRGLFAVAAVVVPHGPDVLNRGAGLLDLAGPQVASLGEVGAGPDQPTGHKYVGRRAEPRAAVALPQGVAGIGREGRQPLPVGPEHDDVANHERGVRHAGAAFPAILAGALGWPVPLFRSRVAVQTDDPVARLEEDALLPGGERERHESGRRRLGAGPEHVARLGTHGDDRFLVREAGRRPGRADRGLLGDGRAGHHQQDTLVEDDFFGALGFLVGFKRLAGRRVEGGQRRPEPERGVHAVRSGHEGPGELDRSGAELVAMPGPRADRTLPEKHAVEGVPGHQEPLARHLHRGRRPLVDDIEDPSFGRDDRADAAQRVMIAGPGRLGRPLHVARRSGTRIVGHGVAGGVVQEVRPLVDLLGPGLDRFRPTAVFPNVRHATRGQHPQHFVCRNIEPLLGHQEADEVVDVGQSLAARTVGRDLAVEAQRPDVPAGPLDVFRRGIQTVNQITVAGAKRGGQLPVAAAEVHNQAASDSHRVEDLSCQGRFNRSGGCFGGVQNVGAEQQNRRA